MTPGEAIRRYCVHCCGGQASAVAGCDGDESVREKGFNSCEFHPYRLGKGRPSVRLIRQFCLSCQGGRADFVRDCIKPSCGLYPFRLGKNPNFTRAGRSAAEMEAIRLKRGGIAKESGGHLQRSIQGMKEGPSQQENFPEASVCLMGGKIVPRIIQGELL